MIMAKIIKPLLKVLVPAVCLVAALNLLKPYTHPNKHHHHAGAEDAFVSVLTAAGGSNDNAEPERKLGLTTTSSTTTGGGGRGGSIRNKQKYPMQPPPQQQQQQRQVGQHQLPNIMIIGTQNAGTNAISGFLHDHVGACGPKTSTTRRSTSLSAGGIDLKEIHFSDVDSRYRSASIYSETFGRCRGKEYIVDTSPDSLRHADRVHNLYEKAGGNQHNTVKFIAILREPVSREWAVYNHLKNLQKNARPYHGNTNEWFTEHILNKDGSIKSFDKFIEMTTMKEINTRPIPYKNINIRPDPYNLGMYAYHLKKWTKYFARKQILILSYDELMNNPSMTISRITQFLGVENNNDMEKSVVLEGDDEEKAGERQPLLAGIAKNNNNNIPKCSTIQRLASVYESLNNELYDLLDDDANKANGPLMELHPFPRFVLPNCTNDETSSASL